ncbi:hypothetical protein ABPG74_000776 [Tetrahymena malaccensis]
MKNYTLKEFQQYNQCELNPFQAEKYILIDTLEKLQGLIQILLEQTRLGIDTEQSFAKTYEGFLCLIQISTDQNDYLIDVLKINDKQGINQCLSKVFLNKDIIKVFYAGQQDILWLKRDFDLSVVNYFDVKECASFLKKSDDNSLIQLIDRYCNFKLDKQKKKELQVSEWSNRPLSKEQLDYAALDSHYLIKLRYELLCETIQSVGFKRTIEIINQMQQQTLKKYEKKKFDYQYFFDLFQKQFKHKEQYASQIDKQSEVYKIINIIYCRVAKLKNEYAEINNLNANNLLLESSLLDLALQIYDLNNNKLALMEDLDLQQFSNLQYPPSLAFLQNQREKILLILNSWNNNEEKNNIFQEYNKYGQKKASSHTEKQERKQKRAQQFEEQFCLKKEPYGNCQILSPLGLKLCNCDEKKVKWYLNKGLATLVSSEPYTVIKLNFQPNGKNHEELEQEIHLNENQFYASKRETVCVVCGKDEKFTKYHVIPSIYRTHFPNKYKSHRSHDILLLCVKCHQKAGKNADMLKDQLLQQYKIEKQHYFKQQSLKYMAQRMYASTKSYLKSKEKMNKENRQKCKENIRQYFDELLKTPDIEKKIPQLKEKQFKLSATGKIKIDEEFRSFFSNLEKDSKNVKEDDKQNERVWAGQKVIENLKTEEEIILFIKMWRQHFLDVMQPKYLPFGWNVNHKFTRDFGKESVFNQFENQNQIEDINENNDEAVSEGVDKQL